MIWGRWKRAAGLGVGWGNFLASDSGAWAARLPLGQPELRHRYRTAGGKLNLVVVVVFVRGFGLSCSLELLTAVQEGPGPWKKGCPCHCARGGVIRRARHAIPSKVRSTEYVPVIHELPGALHQYEYE